MESRCKYEHFYDNGGEYNEEGGSSSDDGPPFEFWQRT